MVLFIGDIGSKLILVINIDKNGRKLLLVLYIENSVTSYYWYYT